MGSSILGYSGKSANYTATIANQNGELICYPTHDGDTGWDVYTGTLIQFVNTTGESIRVTVKPDVYQGADPFTIAPESRTICTVILTQTLINQRILITHHIETLDGPRIVTGGPKMVPTDPPEL